MQAQVKKLDFTGQDIYVGIDTHLKSWKVTIMVDNVLYKTYSQPPQAEVLHQYLVRNFPGGRYHSAYEAGFCGYWIHNRLKALGINSIVVNAADIPTTDKERTQKEDARDSRKIARALRNRELKAIHVPANKILEDRSLIRSRQMIVEDIVRYKQRIKSFLYFHGIEIPACFIKPSTHWSGKFMRWLESIQLHEKSGNIALSTLIQEVKNDRALMLKLTADIRDLSKSTYYKEDVMLLRTIPGIGLLTAILLLAELDIMNRFENIDNLCSYVGLVPSTNKSGDFEKDGEITPRGHSYLRKAIIESSWIAIRNDPALMKSFCEYSKRMPSNKAIIRIGKKLLNRIRFVVKNRKAYEYQMVA
jgi:transposase